MTVTVIINPVSGRQGPLDQARGRAAMAATRLGARGVAVRTVITERPHHAHALAREAVEAGVDVVAAWGGDGTMNEVASALVGTTTALGLVPGGSGNGLARELGIPLTPERALDLLAAGATRRIDGGQLDGRWFFNVAGVGLDARVADAFQHRVGRGLAGYLGSTTRLLLDNAPTPCVIETPGGTWSLDAVLVAVANSRQYGNDVRIAPRARVDDGVLDLVAIRHRSLGRLVARLPWLLAGAIERVPGVDVIRTAEAVIAAEAPLAYHVDGEPWTGGTRLTVRVAQGALSVRVPEPAVTSLS